MLIPILFANYHQSESKIKINYDLYAFHIDGSIKIRGAKMRIIL